jgi:hypothetical protein
MTGWSREAEAPGSEDGHYRRCRQLKTRTALQKIILEVKDDRATRGGE